MAVPAIIFADDRRMEQIKGDQSLEQAMNAAMLPGVVRAAYTMPDIHQGYGLPIGAVVGTRTDGGVVTPGGVGHDINCGVRLLRTELSTSCASRAAAAPMLGRFTNSALAFQVSRFRCRAGTPIPQFRLPAFLIGKTRYPYCMPRWSA